MNDIKIEMWSDLNEVENPNPRDDFDTSFGFAHVWVDNGYTIHLAPWNYSRSQALEDGTPDLEKFEFVRPAKIPFSTQLLVCAEALQERNFLRPSAVISLNYHPLIPHRLVIFNWSDEISVQKADLQKLSEDEMRSKLKLNREMLCEHLQIEIEKLANTGSVFTEGWYLLNIVAMYLSEDEPSSSTLFSVGALYAEYLAVAVHADKYRRNEKRQADASASGGQGMKEKREVNILALFQAAEKEAELGVYDLASEKEFRKAAVRRVTRIYDDENKKFPTSSKIHASYFEQITERPEFRSKYYSFLE